MEKRIIYIIFIGLLFSNKQEFTYKVYSLFSIPVADVKISVKDTTIKNQKSQLVKINCKTLYIADYLYSINNSYQVAIDSDFNILYFSKHINQPNIKTHVYTTTNNLEVVYNQTNIVIPKNTFNIFSLIYYLSITDYETIITKLINNDIEKDGSIYSFSVISARKGIPNIIIL